jgi:hypothetical protein
MRAPDSSKNGAAEAPDWDSFPLQNFPPKQTPLLPHIGSSVISLRRYTEALTSKNSKFNEI